jgi:hypothetical protein
LPPHKLVLEVQHHPAAYSTRSSPNWTGSVMIL